MKIPNGLPEWFNLENYKDTELLSPFEWYENLHTRKLYFIYLNFAKNNWPVKALGLKNAMEGCQDIVHLITTNPVLRRSDEEKVDLTNAITVNSLDNYTLACDYKSLEKRAPSTFSQHMQFEDESEYDDKKYTDMSDYFREYKNLHEFLYDKFSPLISSEARISVNLHATDEHIISDFKNWLENERKNIRHKTAKKIFSINDFKEWAEYKVLPYLDLKLWSDFSGCNITLATIGNALFPDELLVDVTERVRRTTKPKAEWLMEHLILDALDAQIQKELYQK
jgi:hypothetical protein